MLRRHCPTAAESIETKSPTTAVLTTGRTTVRVIRTHRTDRTIDTQTDTAATDTAGIAGAIITDAATMFTVM